MPNTKSETAKIALNVKWDKVGDVTSNDFMAEQFVPNLSKIIAGVQKEIGKIIYDVAYQKAKTAGKFNRIIISVNVSPEIEFDNFIFTPEESRG